MPQTQGIQHKTFTAKNKILVQKINQFGAKLRRVYHKKLQQMKTKILIILFLITCLAFGYFSSQKIGGIKAGLLGGIMFSVGLNLFTFQKVRELRLEEN